MGKSTLFNALTKSRAAQADNYAFCTIDPNVGRVEVQDPRLEKLSELVQPQKTVPATVEFVDIAGLVAGASRGRRAGKPVFCPISGRWMPLRRWSGHSKMTISCMCRIASTPVSDMETINTELMLADMETADKALKKSEKNSKSGDKKQIAFTRLLSRVQAHLHRGQPLGSMDFSPGEMRQLKPLCFLTLKPVLYIANVSEDGLRDNPHLDRVMDAAKRESAPVVAICASIEQELSELDHEDGRAFLEEMGLEEAGLNRVIRAGYSLLGLQTYFTAGPREARAWTIPGGGHGPPGGGGHPYRFRTGLHLRRNHLL